MQLQREIYRVEKLPLFQNKIYHSSSAAKSCATGNVVLVQDSSTGLIFNREFNPASLVYDGDYQNEVSGTAFSSHLDSTIQLIEKHFNNHKLIEIGCGKGTFLEKLIAKDFDVIGLDPAYEGSNPKIRREYFTPETNIRGDGIILRHVLEHIQHPIQFLQLLKESNGGSGKVYIEVPCLDWISHNNSWFDLFYEHVNYFRLENFQQMFGIVYEASHSFGGQYLSIVADLSSLRVPAYSGIPFAFPKNFTDGLERNKQELAKQKLQDASSQIVVWGAASKGVIFSIFMNRTGTPIDFIVDINPSKQGKYLAVTGLKVLAPHEAMEIIPPNSTVIVTNPNYLEEIKSLTSNRFNYQLA